MKNKLFDFRATKLVYKATVDYYLDDGTHSHRGHKEFASLEKAKAWIAKQLDPNLNIDWVICDHIGIELEGK